MWCCFSFPPVFLREDLPCRLQFQSVRAKNRYLVLPVHSTSREHRDQCWGPTMRHPPISSKLHWQTSILAGENISRASVLLWVPQGWLERVLGAVAVEWQCACLHFPPAVPALALAPPPQEQIVGCTWCSWPSPGVSPRVLAIDGWSKNSPCFPVYALRLPPRSSWIKTAGLDKIAFLFIVLGTSMVMVERGWVDPNHLLAAVLSCDIRWLQRAARGLFGALAPLALVTLPQTYTTLL